MAEGGEEPCSITIEVTLSRFPTGDPDHWTQAQREVLEAFRHGYLDLMPGTDNVVLTEDALCMFVNGGWSLRDLTEQLDACDDARLVVGLYDDWRSDIEGGHSLALTPFWPDPSPVEDWYRGLRDRFLQIGQREDGTELGNMAMALGVFLER